MVSSWCKDRSRRQGSVQLSWYVETYTFVSKHWTDQNVATFVSHIQSEYSARLWKRTNLFFFKLRYFAPLSFIKPVLIVCYLKWYVLNNTENYHDKVKIENNNDAKTKSNSKTKNYLKQALNRKYAAGK